MVPRSVLLHGQALGSFGQNLAILLDNLGRGSMRMCILVPRSVLPHGQALGSFGENLSKYNTP